MKEEESAGVVEIPNAWDYCTVWTWWLISIIPFFGGAHRCVLRQPLNGFIYFWTFNEFEVGWFLDFFDLNMLIEKSVKESGSVQFIFFSPLTS
jgi:TM2 domain-containing membrane protein YozV